MTTRERWIVYPLLFLAIGLGIKGGFKDTEQERLIQTDEILCKKLNVEQILGAEALQCKTLHVVDRNNRSRVAMAAGGSDGAAAFEVVSSDGKHAALFSSTNKGSVLKFLDEQNKTALVLANAGKPQILAGNIGRDGKLQLQQSVIFFTDPDLLDDSKNETPSPQKGSESDSKDSE